MVHTISLEFKNLAWSSHPYLLHLVPGIQLLRSVSIGFLVWFFPRLVFPSFCLLFFWEWLEVEAHATYYTLKDGKTVVAFIFPVPGASTSNPVYPEPASTLLLALKPVVGSSFFSFFAHLIYYLRIFPSSVSLPRRK